MLSPEQALDLAERVLAGDDALSELSEVALLRADADQWRHARAAYLAARAETDGIRTGTVFDSLEAEKGGNVSGEDVDALFDRLGGRS